MPTFLKFILVLALVALVAFGGYLLYRYIFQAALPLTQPPGVQAPTAAMQTTQTPGVKLFSKQVIFDYWVNTKTNAAYLVTPEGKIVRTFGDGRDDIVNTQTLQGLHRVDPAPDGTRALMHFGYPANDIFAVFDTETKSWERLPTGTVMATFDHTGQKIAYVRRVNDASSLFVYTLADKKNIEITNLAIADGTLSWKTVDELFVLPQASARAVVDVLAIHIAKKTVRRLPAGGMLSWGPDAALGLRFLPANGASPELRFVQGVDGFESTLPFVTLPSKCAIGQATLYCGVPIEFPPRVVLPDDYLKEKFFSRDSLIGYDIKSGSNETLLDPIFITIDIDHPVIRGKQLLFKNRYDEKLYSVELTQK